MAELQTKVEPTPAPLEPEPPLAEAPSVDAGEKKVVAPPPTNPAAAEETKALAVVENEKTPAPVKKVTGGSLDRDIALAEIEKEKRLSNVKAWEESEKSKAENKAQKQLSAVAAWENSQKAALEAKLRKIEEQLEKKKAEYGEKMKNKIALIHKQAEEKRAMVEAKRGEEFLKAEETAAKYRATGTTPKKLLGCF
ncbi:remorin [Abrus precatorius]|uniref:Remorin n=1 Tax=Abrus precatorius TaxID=3816 RepID=A0A8B8JR75_ABRPR|nr:remorin [Abrus precatorius]